MKVILQKNVLGLGDLGEVKEVSGGYARNYLLPRKLAVSAHAGTVRALKHQKKSIENKARKRRRAMEDLSQKLENLSGLEIQARVGAENKLFGSVTSLAICEALDREGFQIDRRKIELRDSIRSVGKYPIKVKLMEGISSNLELRVVPDAQSLKKMKEEEEKKALPPKKGKAVKTQVGKEKKASEVEAKEPSEEKKSSSEDKKEDLPKKSAVSKDDSAKAGEN